LGHRYLIVGRSRDCDLVLRDGSVSGRHARLTWEGERILIEDLGSANGTFIAGQRVGKAEVRPGDEVRLGAVGLPWSDPRLRPFLRAGATGTILGKPVEGHRYICGNCGARGMLPKNKRRSTVRCQACGSRLVLGKRPLLSQSLARSIAVALALAALVGSTIWFFSDSGPQLALDRVARQLGFGDAETVSAASPHEDAVRRHTAEKVIAAIDADDPVTRNRAVQVASEYDGPYNLDQVAAIWTHVRGRWRYVNDPAGTEYFASASETITNGYAGDCDDFAIVLSAMIDAIGGRTRIVMMDGPAGGHAYAEACVGSDPEDIAQSLSRHYRRTWDRYLGRQSLDEIHFRSSSDCDVWLNLDWNAGVPGGSYGAETWAVAIYPDGHTETLAPAGGEPGSITPTEAAATIPGRRPAERVRPAESARPPE
jgi:DNA-directed RNA polymerase subunit RPC12/RpoP